MTATVPLDVTVTDFDTAVPTETLPKESEVAVRLRVADAAFSCSEIAFELLPVVAVKVTDCVLLTGVTFAVKAALVAPDKTVTELGIETAELLAPSPTLNPPAGAGPDRLTVHESAIDPVIEVVTQETELTVGVPVAPVPLRLSVCDDTLLEIVSCPVIEFAVVGSNWTVSTLDCPGFRVTGRVPFETEKPVPVIPTELMVAAAVPVEVTVTGFVTAAPTATLPNDSDVVLRLNAGVAAFNCIAKLCDEEFALATIVAFCAVLTEATFAVKDVVEAPEPTVKLAGTVTALSLLVTDMTKPLDGAAELSDTVHAVVPAPVKALLPHESALIEAANGDAGPPRLMDVVFEIVP